MLTRIQIQGLAIIDQLAIDFSHGFNVITGETGAGKSILIKALGLLLGSKASAETVRSGRETATVTGLFEAPPAHRAAELMERYGIPFEADEARLQILVRRSVSNKGRSLAWINDVPVTAQVLRELAGTMIDVFGQHDNLRLLDPQHHTSYLDQFVKDRAVLAAYRAAYEECGELLATLSTMIEEVRAKRRDADYLEFRCEELKQFAPSKDDFEAVQSLCRRGGNLLTLASSLEKAQACIDQGADGESLSRPLWEAGRILGKIEAAGDDLKRLAEEAQALASRVDELSYQIGKATASLEVDEGDLEAAQSRLAGYQELFRKLGVADADELVAEHERLEAERSFLQTAATEVATRLDLLHRKAEELAARAAKVSKSRHKARETVKARIEKELNELAMPGATLDVEFAPASRALPALDAGFFGAEIAETWSSIAETLSGLTEAGAERAQFLLSSNPGEDLHPLHKIASGGEVSRIMLALKKGLAAGADTCILVFDEIDAGISGRVADVVGRKMQELAGKFQVICISHLAQVAAFADTHFLVHKFGKDRRTESTITRLKAKESEEEIARLLSGAEVTNVSLANARALIAKARPKTPAPVKEKDVAKAR